MSRLTDSLLGMDERPTRAFPAAVILNLPASAKPRLRWRAALGLFLALGAAVGAATVFSRPTLAPGKTPSPILAHQPAPVSIPGRLEGDELFRDTMRRGLEAAQRGALDEAKRLFERALEFNAASAEGWNNLGVVLIKQGNSAAGVAALRRALSLKPAYAETHRNLAVALEHQGESIQAVRHYLYFLSLSQEGHPDRAEISHRLGPARPRSDQ